ncbi:hypothetical protein [uncultured Ruegeria sp.]|uniref:hypothetical protein n=1 Tax=uncultured Ruegeria sp. TaxID=259304 RepID=UPI002626AA2B|nr:hypothetical protein [uncultured Ruegeria sp.]
MTQSADSMLDADHHNDTSGTSARAVFGSVFTRVLIAGVLVILFAALYGRIMGYGLRRDELMFVPPAELLGYSSLYGDFFYNHVPNSAWFYRGFYLIFGGEGLLASARFGQFCAWLLLASGVSWATWRISGSALLSVFFVVVLVVNETLQTQAGMAASNNLLPLPFAAWGLGLFIVETLRDRPRFAQLLISGLLLSIAAGLKVSAVIFIPPVAVAAFLLPWHLPFSDRLRSVVLPVLIGGLVGALPLFWYLAADPSGFLAHVLKFHTGPHIAYWQANAASEPGLAMGLGKKIQLAYATWFSGAALIGLMILFFLGVLSAAKSTQKRNGLGQILVVLAVLGMTALFSFVPTPGFPQYYIQPLIAVPLLAAFIYRLLPDEKRAQVVPLCLAGFALLFLLGAPRLAPGLLSLAKPDSFTSARIAKGGAALRDAVADSATPDGPVATFMPLYPLEAHLPVYAELATGPFAYRIAPYTDPELAQQYVMAGEKDLPALFDSNPPSAFLLGYDSDLEAPLLRYANENGYAAVQKDGLNNRYGEGVIYLRRADAAE